MYEVPILWGVGEGTRKKQAQICAEGCEGDDLCCFATKPQKYITGTKFRLDPRLGIRLDYAQVRSLVTILQG